MGRDFFLNIEQKNKEQMNIEQGNDEVSLLALSNKENISPHLRSKGGVPKQLSDERGGD